MVRDIVNRFVQVYFIASSRLVAKNKQIYERMYRQSSEHKMVSKQGVAVDRKGWQIWSEATIKQRKIIIKTIKAINVGYSGDEISGHRCRWVIF